MNELKRINTVSFILLQVKIQKEAGGHTSLLGNAKQQGTSGVFTFEKCVHLRRGLSYLCRVGVEGGEVRGRLGLGGRVIRGAMWV